MAEQENLNIPMIATVGVVSVVLTAATVIAVQALYFNYAADEIERKVVAAPTADADSKLAEQIAKLSRYSWANREKQIVTIPIERAMRLVVQEKRPQRKTAPMGTPAESEVP